jgi:hypothetical protein
MQPFEEKPKPGNPSPFVDLDSMVSVSSIGVHHVTHRKTTVL